MKKFAFIGAGSVTFTRTVVRDLFTFPAFKDAEIMLMDINEEKQRLTNHLNYFMETMENGHGQGKKLGFIAQEMGREINTTGSKSNLAEMQNIVVMMKDELEQIKEQVLNVM